MKIFCIGYNKTGTTSLSKIFENNNFLVAPQQPFEYNLESFFYGNYSTYINMIKNDYYDCNLFQDVPFSLPNFYKELDAEFKNSKFILTIRDSEEVWYNSLINFYKKIFINFNQPKKIDGYVYKGILFKILTEVYGAPKTNPYDIDILKKSYLKHNEDVREYFKNRNNLLVVNLKDVNLIDNLEKFLNIKMSNREIPHLNKTK